MSTTGKRIIQKVLAIIVIITLTMADFLIVGENVISYAASVVEVNNKNVVFNAYFEEDSKTLEATRTIEAKDLKLAIELNVENDGYLSNGKIEIEEGANFKFITNYQNSHISKIEENAIYLNQINESDNVKIEVGVEFANKEEIDVGYLNKESAINLTGTYINSKNVENNKSIEIKGKAIAKINWTSSEEIKSVLEAKLLTNTEFSIEGENEHIVQMLVSSKIENNSYPVKNTKIELELSKAIENVTVHKRTTSATNGDKEFTQNNYTYNDGKLIINVENGQNGKIAWKKNAVDEFIVTMQYPQVIAQEVSITEPLRVIQIKSVLTTFDEKELSNDTELVVEKEKEGAVTLNAVKEAEPILKGKVYSGEEKHYTTTSELNIDFAKGVKQIEVENKKVVFEADKEEKEANVEYIKTTISKANFTQIFGKEGELNILDQDGNTVETISSNTDANNEENIVIEYANGTTETKFTFTNPVAEGILKIHNEKKILKSEYEREELEKITRIKEPVKIIYTKNDDKTIEKEDSITSKLKETSTKASLMVQQSTLSTAQEQELNIAVDLETNNEERDLYKNPEINITFPKQIKSIKAQGKLLYGNGLSLEKDSIKIEKENGKYVIKGFLKGEQESYPGDAVEGARLLINTKVEVDKLATNSKEDIVLEYTNENASNYEDKGTQKVSINILSESPVILTNNIEEYNISTIGNEGEKEVEIQAKSEAKKATVEMEVINNEEAEISNVIITGKIANAEGIKREGKIEVDQKDAKVYYTSNENPTSEINEVQNGWTEENIKDAKNYLVSIENVKNAEKINMKYNILIGKNIGYNIDTETGYEVAYKNDVTNAEKKASATLLKLSTGKLAEVKAEYTAEVAGAKINSGDEVKAGEIITYTAKLTNSGREKAENISLTATIPDNTTLIQVNPHYVVEEGEIGENEESPEYFIKKQERTIQKQNITIEPGKTNTYKYTVQVNTNLDRDIIAKSELLVKDQEKEISKIEITNRMSKANIYIVLEPKERDGNGKQISGKNYLYQIKITNQTDVEQKNVLVAINKSDLIEFTSMDCLLGERYTKLDNNTRFTISSIPARGTAYISISTKTKPATQNVRTADMVVYAKDSSGFEYRSNKLSEGVEGVGIIANIESTVKNDTGYLYPGKEIKYLIHIKNTGEFNANALRIEDKFSDYLDIQNITLNGQKAEYQKQVVTLKDADYSIIRINSKLEKGKELTVQINAIVNEGLSSIELLKATNKALIYNDNILVAETEEKVAYIKSAPDLINNSADEINDINQQQENPQNVPNNPNMDQQNDANNIEERLNQARYIVSGTVWEDSNQNGARDSGENSISGVKVYAINITNNEIAKNINGAEIVASTNAEGSYTLENIQRGKYIIVFEYDTGKYIPTLYQADGIASNVNSDAVKATGTVKGERKVAAITDSINLTESKANIDLGLAQAKVFKLNLEKVVSKMIVTNSSGTKTYDFNDTKLAKAEIESKDINGSSVVVEYKMKITNNGEVAGYARKIVDYVPSSLQFNSSLNNGWYKQNGYLYNTTLANTKIEPGETKEIKLVLTKSVTATNTGLTNNKAEIVSSYNELGIENEDQKTDVKAENSKNKSADILVSPSTGSTVSYITLSFIITLVICGAAYLVVKKRI